MSAFWIRLINVVAIVAILFGYNQVISNRQQADARAKAQAESEEAEYMAEHAAEYAAVTEAPEKFKDGTYTASAQGFGGLVEVAVTVGNGRISKIEVVSAEKEDATYLEMAKQMIPQIIESQSAEVDTVSGATFSSTGIKNAVAQALEEAE